MYQVFQVKDTRDHDYGLFATQERAEQEMQALVMTDERFATFHKATDLRGYPIWTNGMDRSLYVVWRVVEGHK